MEFKINHVVYFRFWMIPTNFSWDDDESMTPVRLESSGIVVAVDHDQVTVRARRYDQVSYRVFRSAELSINPMLPSNKFRKHFDFNYNLRIFET